MNFNCINSDRINYTEMSGSARREFPVRLLLSGPAPAGGTRHGTEFVTRLFINMYDVKPRRGSINVSSYITDDVGSRGRKSRRPQIGLSDFRATRPDKNRPERVPKDRERLSTADSSVDDTRGKVKKRAAYKFFVFVFSVFSFSSVRRAAAVRELETTATPQFHAVKL